MDGPAARICAALVALAAWTGLAAGCTAVFGRTGSVGATAWVMLGYFTNTTGLLAAVLFTALAANPRGLARPATRARAVAAAALMTLLVGIVQQALLRGLRPLAGPDLLADAMLHLVLPVAVPLFWLVFAGKGRLRRVDPLIWTAYPLAFLGYALVRGALGGRYAYPFIDGARFGWGTVAVTCAVIAAGFVAVGMALVALDRLLAGARPGRRGEEPDRS
ncbi:MAG: hypothetical protein COT28_06485 [Methylobacterium sp. CG08_land_8_20_14_0_20_71_15]|nr:MAG: hypothetical protein COT56_08100 [Methylobacterium sp. CG09_land_8_20_14_0_10_71_15]PIU14860.1 MAG: hypothetical protein COT28_06485 [Methylobacterium sp. CG08_land_8_20_14_0_20_71_15]GBU17984.1 hypothetical protein AwMethylo_21990 [Methylobacterium sp.]